MRDECFVNLCARHLVSGGEGGCGGSGGGGWVGGGGGAPQTVRQLLFKKRNS